MRIGRIYLASIWQSKSSSGAIDPTFDVSDPGGGLLSQASLDGDC